MSSCDRHIICGPGLRSPCTRCTESWAIQALSIVCWHHGNVPSLAHADGEYPDPWNRSVFNLIADVMIENGAPSAQQIEEPF